MALSMSSNKGDDDPEEDEEETALADSTIRFDDRGSDLTDRFKYKVNALSK